MQDTDSATMEASSPRPPPPVVKYSGETLGCPPGKGFPGEYARSFLLSAKVRGVWNRNDS
jgi:hypothetical protein